MALNMDPTLIPFPAFADRLIPDRDTRAWSRLGPRTVKGFVLHRMLGSLDGTDAYFRSGAGGLTDFGQDSQTGTVYRWNDPDGAAHDGVSPDRSGWASGSVILPYGDGLAFVRKYGIEAVNRDQLSWEIDRFYDDPWDEVAMQIAAQACAANAQEYGIPWDVWPIAPQDGFSFVRWHQEFTGPQEKACPGDVVMGQTAHFIELVRDILRHYQTGTAGEPAPAAPRYAPVMMPDWLTPAWIAGGEDAYLDGTKVFSCRRRWGVRMEAPVRQHAGPVAPAIGPPRAVGSSFIGVGIYHSHGRWLVLDEWGGRTDMEALTDKVIPGYWDEEAA